MEKKLLFLLFLIFLFLFTPVNSSPWNYRVVETVAQPIPQHESNNPWYESPNGIFTLGIRRYDKNIEDPTIIGLPEDISKESTDGICGTIVSWTPPTTQEGSTITQTAGPASGSVFPVGIATIEYTATNTSNQKHSESFTITVNDTEDPTIVNLPANITESNDTGVCGAQVSWIAPTSADNCSGSSIAQTAGPSSGSVFPVGTTTVTYKATDVAGNDVESSFTVTVNDTEDPTIVNLPANITQGNDAGVCGATISWLAPTSADNCNGSTIAQTSGPANGSVFPVGTITVTYTATDVAGNDVESSFTVTVNDTEEPTIVNLPANITESNDPGVCGAEVSWTAPTAADNCSTSIEQTAGPSSGSVFPVGTTMVTYTATDASNNTYSESFTVTVNDTEDPTIVNIPANITQSNDIGVCGATISWPTPISEDNCTGSTIAQTAGPSSGSVFPVGTTTVTYTATDASNNTYSESFTVTVNDTEDPTIVNLPANIIASNDTGVCGATISWPAPTSADNCTGSTIAQTEGPASGSVFPVGTTTVTYTATDASDNTYSESFTVTVTDDENPVVIATADFSKETDTAKCTATVIIPDAAFSDNCPGSSLSWTMSGVTTGSGTGQVGGKTLNLGITTILYTVTDASGNVFQDSVEITILDIEKPTIISPSDIIVNTDTDKCTASNINLGIPSVNDNCGVKDIINDAPTEFVIGITEVTWTVTDNSNNTQTTTQSVTVNDKQAPAIPNLPDLISECPITIVPPTTIDNCGEIITGETSITNFTFVESGIIFWTFTDNSGNKTGAVEQKIIINNVPPVPDIPTQDEEGYYLPELSLIGCQISGLEDLIIPTATDCEGIIEGTLGENFVFPYEFTGTQTIYWLFIDDQGNVETQRQNITLTPETVSGGNLSGTYQNEDFESQVDISSCGDAISVNLQLSGQIGSIVHWEKLAVNNGTWQTIANTSSTYNAQFAVGALESTYYRALVKVGTCTSYSSRFYIRGLPPGAPPDVTSLDPDNLYCLGEPVKLLAKSNYLATEDAITYPGGDFNIGQINANDPDSWLVDNDMRGFTANGSNTKAGNWSGSTQGKEFGDTGNGNNKIPGIKFYSGGQGGNSKFAIANGNFYSNDYKGSHIPTTLATPILDFSNSDIESASLDFDQAYFFSDDDYAVIEISFDGGATYQTLKVIHGAGSGNKNWYIEKMDAGEPVGDSDANNFYFDIDNTSISLADVLQDQIDAGNSVNNVRIRWSFTGTNYKSAWALDNIIVSRKVPVETEVEWTEGIGDPDEPPLSTGKTEVEYSFTADIPGIHKYGGTALINGCRTYSEEGTGLIEIKVSSSYAGEDITNAECGQNLVQLNAYDNTLSANENIAKGAFNPPPPGCKTCDAPGSGETGTWTAVRQGSSTTCEEEMSFSDDEDADAIFTASPGTYILTWTVNGCADDITVTITDCTQIDFDGVDDYVDFNDNYDLSGAFSLEVWVKPESVQGAQTIFSKRNANSSGNSAKGYDLSIKDGEVSFSWDNGSITSSPHKIKAARWYHISLTRSASNEYNLYVDGILIKTSGGTSPGTNNNRTLLGAMDKNGSLEPTHFFHGWMEELRIWNVALTEDQLHRMMNQRIIKNGTGVEGETIPLNIPDLNWSNLIGYYRMSNISCGNINPYANVGVEGKLKNITSDQESTAPLPYTTKLNDQLWTNNAENGPWTNWDVWDIPNSNGINGKPIEWNIVELSHDIASGSKDIKILGLISESGKFTVVNPSSSQDEYNSGQLLHVTHYLKLDGAIDLEGESQLIQSEGSILDEESSGYLDRDQQGKRNSFVYNYWSSPVSSVTGGYTVKGVLRDPKSIDPINFQGYHGAADGTLSSPITISSYWLNAFAPATANQYSAWIRIGENGDLLSGEGFTMKGTAGINAGIDAMQNYTFRGKPHNGNIQLQKLGPNQNYLIGNPYPSAIDANQLINDFGTSTNPVFDGSLYFWDHFVVVDHILKDYIGGYATYNLIGGISGATSSDERIDNNMSKSGKIPKRYIPVGQGFLVNSTDPNSNNGLGGDIIFKNSYRIFKRESIDNSIFLKPETVSDNTKSTEAEFIKLRLSFSSPVGYWRQILAGAVPGTTDGFDLGYDAHLFDNNIEDMYWIQGNNHLVIQGVNDFNKDRILPLGVKIKEEEPFTIRIDTVENADKNLKIYLFDKLNDSIHDLRKEHYVSTSKPGIINDRFEVIFFKEEPIPPVVEIPLEIDENDEIYKEFGILVRHGRTDRELQILNPHELVISNMYIFDLRGNKLEDHKGLPGGKEFRMPVANYSSGVYIVQLVVEGRVVSKKIIINN